MLFDFSNNRNTNLWMPENKLSTNYLPLCSSEMPSETSHHINCQFNVHNFWVGPQFVVLDFHFFVCFRIEWKKNPRPNIRILHPSEHRHDTVWATRCYLYIFPTRWIFILSGGGSIVIIWIPYSNKSDKRPSLRGSNKISQTFIPVYL